MKALVFGAGNIGRGFLGQLLAKAGFFITFIDVNEKKVALINILKEYPVFMVSGAGVKEQAVRGINAIYFADSAAINKAVVESDIILTAVGKDALSRVAICLADGLTQRIKQRPHSEIHVVVVACENIQDNTSYLKSLLLSQTPEEYREKIDGMISFPNCVVDRIVPNTTTNREDDLLTVTVEDYFQFAIDKTALKANLPLIPGIELSTNLSATLEQKLFTLNMAHAITAYFGWFKRYQFIHEAIKDPHITSLLAGALNEVEGVIMARHTHISANHQREYANKVVNRFANPYLADEITRVARDPMRKLGFQDRLVHPASLAAEQGQIPAFLATGIAAALHYNCPSDSQAQKLVAGIRTKGIERVLQEVSMLTPQSQISQLVKADFLLRSL